ncbi:MAG: ABC transporter permease subunit [Candidatus Caldatribacteriota bacterium]|jgi:ABC-2 type transport system permease protein|nr:ABC transporter permease subunit [Atribacterota bacterium]MDD3641408.1 ABC transporter permease subunit [Atribacterota bacterium]MDD4289361.1 ABC transporter permease subunit [Atribacterota bacterium]MDD4765921.1 ABC transporter permease subunit [Atribacterota bacterium]
MSGLNIIYWKELADYLGSKKFIIIFMIVALTAGSIIFVLSQNISNDVNQFAGENLFLKLFTFSGGTLPSFIFFVSFFGPLIGIIFGFDAINSERTSGTMSTVLSQPVYRDALINGKFLAGLTTIAVMLISIIIIIFGLELIIFGIIPSVYELVRIGLFFMLSIIYIGFWMGLGILFSIIFKQTATSALVSIMVWIFFTFFILMVANVVADQVAPIRQDASLDAIAKNEDVRSMILRISPLILFQESTTAILNPSVRFFGIASALKSSDVILSPLSIGQSLLVVWPQFVALIALTLICFAISYIVFMRQEIRST